MTIEEALEWFKNDLKDGKCSEDCPDCNAREKAIEALEKQIPKKIRKEHYYFGTLYVCPECRMSFGARDVALDKRYKGCPYCLQAIDWSDDEI